MDEIIPTVSQLGEQERILIYVLQFEQPVRCNNPEGADPDAVLLFKRVDACNSLVGELRLEVTGVKKP
jgi:hypothetical protein